MTLPRERTIDVAEHPQIPRLSIVLGFGPALLVGVGALAAWISPAAWRTEVVSITTIYAAAILAFLGGVRRGLSFRTEGGPAAAQIVTMFTVFSLALLALLGIAHGFALAAILLLVIGYAGLLVLDPVAAEHGQAPLFFARLRAPQMAIVVASLIALFAIAWLDA